MNLKYRLLEHPFYKEWTKGNISHQQLSEYHKSYSEFIRLMPVYWNKIIDSFELDDAFAKSIIKDEILHIELWDKWSDKLHNVDDYPKMTNIIESLNSMNPSELLGAVQAFETQQPEVAETKKCGLIEHYGFNESETVYFDEHMNEDAHIEFGNMIKNKYADENDYERGFQQGSELFYKGLDLFLK